MYDIDEEKTYSTPQAFMNSQPEFDKKYLLVNSPKTDNQPQIIYPGIFIKQSDGKVMTLVYENDNEIPKFWIGKLSEKYCHFAQYHNNRFEQNNMHNLRVNFKKNLEKIAKQLNQPSLNCIKKEIGPLRKLIKNNNHKIKKEKSTYSRTALVLFLLSALGVSYSLQKRRYRWSAFCMSMAALSLFIFRFPQRIIRNQLSDFNAIKITLDKIEDGFFDTLDKSTLTIEDVHTLEILCSAIFGTKKDLDCLPALKEFYGRHKNNSIVTNFHFYYEELLSHEKRSPIVEFLQDDQQLMNNALSDLFKRNSNENNWEFSTNNENTEVRHNAY